MRKLKIDQITIIAIIFISFWVSSNLNWGEGRPQTIMGADGKAYYAHLPALFIYHDVNFGFFDEYEGKKYYNKHLYYYYLKEYNGKLYNKYFCGTAVPMAPFFFMAHGLSYTFGLPTDGYADLYHIFINIAAIFYLAVALIFMGKLLDRFNFKNSTKALTYLVFYFGTNWFYWVNLQPSISHVYSVAFTSIFFYYLLTFFDNKKFKHLIISTITLGLIILIRPLNGICVLALPLFFHTKDELLNNVLTIIKKPKFLLACVLIPLSVASLQLILYKLQVGHFFIYSYEKEGLYLWKPHLLNFLFSYRKGLFVYTPVLLIAIMGFYYWYKKNKMQSIAGALFILTICYVLSCWHMWWYGGGFGTRVMIEYYIVWMIPLAFLLDNIKGWSRKVVISVLVILVLYCQFQTCQYRYNIIHWDGISKTVYWDIFLKPWF